MTLCAILKLPNLMKITLLLLLTIPLFGLGQDNSTFISQHFCDTIPFEYVRNKIIVEVKINEQKKRFIFDTGAPSCISDRMQSQMNNDILDTTFLTDLSGIRKQILVVSVKQLTLGTLFFEYFPSAVINKESTGLANCINYDGIIGSNLLINCIVQIDTKKKQIILTDNINNLNLQNASQSKLTLDNQGSPHIQLNLNNKIKFDALFDSGASDFITISDGVVKKILNSNMGKVLNKGYGIGAIGIFGIEKANFKNRVLCNNVKFGKVKITNFVTEVSNKSENIIGMELADYGTITIDYVNKLFYFAANHPSQQYRYQKTLGFSFQPDSNYYSIATVWTGTKAERMGLKSGYQILKINDLDISKRTQSLDCRLLFTRPLSKQRVKLKYKDDKNKIKKVQLTEE